MATKPTTAPSGALKQLLERVEKTADVMRISPKALWQYLGILGIDKAEDSLALLESDAAEKEQARLVLVNGIDPVSGAPILKNLARVGIIRFNAGWEVLTGKPQSGPAGKKDVQGIEKLVETLRPIEQWPDEEVLAAYGPECESRVMDELRKRIPDSKKIFIFDKDEKLNVKASLELFKLARRKQPVPSTYVVDGRLCRTFGLGEFSATFVEECPLHRHVILANGFCEECQALWSPVSEAMRLAVRVAVTCGEYKGWSPGQIQSLIENLSKTNWVNRSDSFHPLAVKTVQMKYDELTDDNQLPILKKRLSTTRNADPLYVEHRSY